MSEKIRFNVTLSSRLSITGFLDMLRYEQATVRTWGYPSPESAGDVLVVYLEAPTFTPERWQSFGYNPVVEP